MVESGRQHWPRRCKEITSRPLELTTCSKSCHFRFPPKTLPLVPKIPKLSPPQPARSHISILIMLLHFAPPQPHDFTRVSATITQLRLMSSALLSSFSRTNHHRHQTFLTILSVYLSVLKRKKENQTPCICICLTFFVVRALYAPFVYLACL